MPGAPKKFPKKRIMKITIRIENLHVFTHIFFNTISAFTSPFLRITQILNFSCVLPIDSMPKELKIFFLKKLYEDLCSELDNFKYTHTIFNAQFRIYKHFLITQIS